MQAIEVAMPGTPEWLAARQTGFGGSEICAAAGERLPPEFRSRFNTPLEVAARKLGLLPEFEGNAATRRGQRAEKFVLETFLDESGLQVARYPMPMFRHPKWEFIFATPDALLTNGEGAEIKTSTSYAAKGKWGEEGTDDIPADYLCQAQLEAEILDVQFVNVVLMVGDWKLQVYRVERNQPLIDGLIDAAHDLWKLICAGQLPEPTWEHPSTLDLMKDLHRTIDPGKVIVLSEDAVAAVARRTAINKEIKVLETEYDALTAKILSELGDANAGDLGDGYVMRRKVIQKASYVVSASSYTDMRRVKMKTFMEEPTAIPSVVPTPVNVGRRDSIAMRLEALGYRLKDESPAGSRYYCALGKPDVRLADHAPNYATESWMAREGVKEIRFDGNDFEVRDAFELIALI
jgi:predicted phage-related endonuclease